MELHTHTHSLKVTAGSGVNFCSTCGPAVYPLALPTLSWNDVILMICLINYSSPLSRLLASHPSLSLFPSVLSFLMSLCVKGKFFFFFFKNILGFSHCSYYYYDMLPTGSIGRIQQHSICFTGGNIIHIIVFYYSVRLLTVVCRAGSISLLPSIPLQEKWFC